MATFNALDAAGATLTIFCSGTNPSNVVPVSCPTDGIHILSSLFDLDTSGSTHEWNMGLGIRISGSGGSIEAKGQQSMANSLPVALASNQTSIPITVASLPLPAGAATAALQPSLGTAGTASANVITVQGIASMTALIVDGSAVTQPANVTKWNGTTVDTNSGNKSAGTIRVVIATDQPALTNKLLVTPDSVALPAHQSANVDQWNGTTVDTNSGNKSAGTVRVVLATDQPALTNKLLVTPDSVALPANQSVNMAQIAATTTDTNSGNKSAGTLRVVIATDQPALTNTLKVDPSGVTSPVDLQPATSGGLSVYSALSTAAVLTAAVKASAGQVYGIEFFNNTATPVYVRLYNMTTAPASTDGASIIARFMVPGNTAGAGVVKSWDNGLAFGTGIGIRATASIADNDTTALSANTVIVNVEYK